MSDYHYLIRGGIAGRERLRVLGRVMRPTTLLLSSVRVSPQGCVASMLAAAEVT